MSNQPPPKRGKGNRLAQSLSPYLLQHAANPVDWHLWGEEALAKARADDKPILLSIGYSACHWCHVMEHESFSDEAIAAQMNRLFVNIKVDREERPDIDSVYQLLHNLFNRRPGGWPLTAFLEPRRLSPIHIGTYFPPMPSRGLPSFPTLMQRVEEAYRLRAADIERQSEQFSLQLQELVTPEADDKTEPLNVSPLDRLPQALAGFFDREHGGFGGAPKFPQHMLLDRALRDWWRQSSASRPEEAEQSLAIASASLVAMSRGGLRDHLGGGFFRYTVDGEWSIPHFEKMLYDNALLIPLYAALAAIKQEKGQRALAAEASEAAATAADWVLAEMRHDLGGFYSTLDADSEGREGAFYLWTRERAEESLGEGLPLLAAAYGLDGPANFEGSEWHLRRLVAPAELARRFAVSQEEAETALARARSQLLENRRRRPPPALDDKVLTSWNGLMISALARSGRLLGRDDYIDAAAGALDFIRAHLCRQDGLKSVWRKNKAWQSAFLADYAYVVAAIYELLQARWSAEHLEFAESMANAMIERFADEKGGFFMTSASQEKILYRPFNLADEALPSANALAAGALNRLGLLLGNNSWLDVAEATVRRARKACLRHPLEHSTMLNALEDLLESHCLVVVRASEPRLGAIKARWGRLYRPKLSVFCIPAEAEPSQPALASKEAKGDFTAYLCIDMHCLAPLSSEDELEVALNEALQLGKEPLPPPSS